MKTNQLRQNAGFIYLLGGPIACGLATLWFQRFAPLAFYILWSVALSAAGIGFWLINSRDHNNPEDLIWDHYLLYFGFALIFCSIASFTAGILQVKPDDLYTDWKFYSTAALTGLATGFMSEQLEKLIPKITK